MNIVKATLKFFQTVLPRSWQRTAAPSASRCVDRFEAPTTSVQKRRLPPIDWAEIDRQLPQGEPLQVMDKVLGSSPWYFKVQVPSIYGSTCTTPSSQSQASLLPPDVMAPKPD